MNKVFVSTMCIGAVSVMGGRAATNEVCDATGQLTIISATDDGQYDDTRGPENSIDGVLDSKSNESMVTPKHLTLDLGATQTLKSLGIAWYKGDSRKSAYTIQASTDGTNFETIVPERDSTGATLELEPIEFDDLQARYVRIEGNDSNSWNSVVEVVAYGCGTPVEKPAEPVLTERLGTGLFNLHTDRPPARTSTWQAGTSPPLLMTMAIVGPTVSTR